MDEGLIFCFYLFLLVPSPQSAVVGVGEPAGVSLFMLPLALIPILHHTWSFVRILHLYTPEQSPEQRLFLHGQVEDGSIQGVFIDHERLLGHFLYGTTQDVDVPHPPAGPKLLQLRPRRGALGHTRYHSQQLLERSKVISHRSQSTIL